MTQELDFTSASSNIASVRFVTESEADLDSESYGSSVTGQLFVTFKKGGSVYRYDDVPLDTYERMLEAELNEGSCGKFFHASVRNEFACERVAG